ncbi:unnamed protein product [Blepharisma stoltei]|uniref:Uncharacterized protein n=1 Tax=Blepharisma stoltei TaxID=1481888 RepID=A0AAU9J341_9CILI|nr:unnamed protein product [Blepharisma stoltei]
MSQPNKEVLEKYAELQVETIKSELQKIMQNTFNSLSEDSSKSAIQESQELHRQIDSLNRQLQEITQTLTTQTSCNESPKPHSRSSPSILNSTIQSLKELQESTNLLIQNCKGIFPKVIISQDSKVSIQRFYCKESEEKIDQYTWVLNVANETKDYFRKVEFFILEDNLKIAEIRLIEPDTDIKKHIGLLDVKDIYGKHIIAKIDDFPVSEIFPIMRIEFKGAEQIPEEDENNPKNLLKYTILNSSPETIDNLYVFCNETCEKYYTEKELDYGEMAEIVVPYGNLESVSLRVMKDDEVMSIAYALNLGGEEGEESSEEDVDSDGPQPKEGNGLSFSSPAPVIRPPVMDPAAKKINQLIETLEIGRICLADQIKRNYPGIDSKMQLFKAVSRYTTYEDCIDYLVDGGVIEQ